jgi:hypothetical protein
MALQFALLSIFHPISFKESVGRVELHFPATSDYGKNVAIF